MNHRRCLFLSVVALGLVLPVPATAQDLNRNSPKIVALFAPVVEKPSQSVVRVQCNGKDAALGTVVGEDGWIITKASEIKGGKIVCRCKDGRTLDAVVVAEDDKHDLALLRVEAKDLVPVEWADSKAAPPGRWVASAGTGNLPVAIGVIGVAARNLTGRGAAPAPSPTSGYLGVGFDIDFAGVKISQLTPNAPAQKAGLKVGDQIVAVNGAEVNDPDDVVAIIQRHKPGEVLTLKIERDEKEQILKVTLGKRPANSRADMQNSMGSQLSQRRTGFPVILQHDGVVKPADCGGPLVDLEGRVVGINIARAGRTETHAIPGEVVRKLLNDLLAGKPELLTVKPKEAKP
jgi:serine protease Do